MIGYVINGTATMFYGGYVWIVGGQVSLTVTLIALFIAGLSSAYTLIPQLGEMIQETEQHISTRPEDKDRLNDMNSGLFNLSFSLGNIFGPLIGNMGYISIGFDYTSLYLGIALVLYAVIYFLFCDDLLHKR
jgi:predicted MFS family arabinose efflux permease